MIATKSEILFENLCNKKGILYERIEEYQFGKTADYRIWINSIEIVVEVKQIEISEHEEQLIASAEVEDSPFIVSDIHTRIRNKFDKAKKQLKQSSKESFPALFVIFDNTQGLSGMDSEDILTAVCGSETVGIQLSRGKKIPIINRISHYFGGQRKFDRHHNRSVSGICWLRVDNIGDPYLQLYHNEFANVALSQEDGKVLALKQYERPPSTSKTYRSWREINVRG